MLGVRTHLVAFIGIDRKRLKDADRVSVRSGNLKIKSHVHHHSITHPISAYAQSFPEDRRVERGVKQERRIADRAWAEQDWCKQG